MAAEHPGLGALYVIWAIPSGWTLKLLLFVCLFPNYYCCVPDAAENIVLCVVIWFLSQDNSPPMKLLPQRVFRSSVQFSSVQLLSCVQLFVTPWTVLRQASLSITNYWEFTQTHVHWVGDATQPSHPLLSPPPPAFNLSHHQSLFRWVNSSHQVAQVLEFQLQHKSFQWISRTDFL